MARLAGIDVGTTHVRVALVRTSYRRVGVEALSEARIDERGEEAAIREAFGALRPEGMAIALSGERCFCRRFELPAAATRELESVVGYELESSVPFELDDAVFDKRVTKAASGGVTVFAAVARREDVEARIAVAKAATGREPEVVDTGSITLANLVSLVPELAPAVAPGETPTPIALLDLGERRSELVVLAAGEPVFVRTISRGVHGLPESAPALARELKQSIAALRAQGFAAPTTLWLVGSGSSVRGAEAFLSGSLELPVERLPGLRLDGVPPERADDLPAFAKAVALALSVEGKSRSLNLRQGPLAMARSFAFLREKIPVLSGLAAVVLASFLFSAVAERRALSAERELLDEQLKAVTREVLGEETSDPAKATELLEKGPASEDDPLPPVDAFDVMVQFAKAVPEKNAKGEPLVHDVAELDVTRGHATIQGLIPDTEAALPEKIATAMREFPCFRDVRVQKTTKAGPDTQKYILELELRCEDKKDSKKGGKKPDDKEPAKPEEGAK